MRRVALRGIWILVIVFSLLALSLTGIAASAKEKISFYTWSPAPSWTETYKKLVEMFEESHPEIEVELILHSNAVDLAPLLTRVAGGIAPDVMQVHGFTFKDLASQGLFMDISPLLERDNVNLKEFFPAEIAAVTYQGKMYGLPFDLGYQLMAYRPEICENAGVADPMELWKKGEWTWLTLKDVMKKVTKWNASGEIDISGMVIQRPVRLEPWVYGAGGSMLNESQTESLIDSAPVRNAINFLLDLEYKDRTLTSNWLPFVQKGRFGFWPQASSIVTFLSQFDYSFDLIPHPRGPVNDVTTAVVNSIVIYSKTKHQKAAWEFAKFMTMGEGIKYMMTNNCYTPTMQSLVPAYVEGMKKRKIRGAACFPKDIQRAKPIETTLDNLKYRTLIDNGLAPVWTREKAVESTLADLKRVVDEFLSKQKK